jgi:phospholipase/carboxylesterase
MPTDVPFSTESAARLKARPGVPASRGVTGFQHLGLRRKREALLYVPETALDKPAPLAVMLHGAGGNAEHGLGLIKDYADQGRLIVLAPESRKNSWDIILESRYGPDVSFIDDALLETFSLYAIDGERIALGGFSDGASYALSLGLSNGSLFQYVLAFSPGFIAPVRVEGRPRIFISHGTRDDVLPIDRCSRKLVGFLQQHNLPVRYREFEGPHTVPPEVKQEAIDWFLDRRS